MEAKIKRQTINSKTAFTFDVESKAFLVKNFTGDDIFVSFESDTTDANSILIPADVAQVCATNARVTSAYNTKTIYVKGTGVVEVQAICFGAEGY